MMDTADQGTQAHSCNSLPSASHAHQARSDAIRMPRQPIDAFRAHGSGFARVLLALLLLLPLASALECTEEGLDVILGDQAGNIVAVLMLTAMVIALAYMAGTAMGNAHWIMFAKDEMYHLVFSVLMLVGFSGLLVLSCNIMNFFFMNLFTDLDASLGCYSVGTTMSDVAECYSDMATSDARQIADNYLTGYVDNMMWSTFSVGIAIPLFDTFTATIAAYKRVISAQYDTVLNMFIIPALVSISMQQLIIGFINQNILRWILPSAFLLRVFVPTRQMGNALIALAIGIYMLVPYMYTFNLSMYDAVLTDNDCMRAVGGGLHYYDAICDSVLDGYACWAYDGSTPSPQNACGNPNSFWMVARLVPQAFLLPNLTIALLVAFIGSVAKAFKVIG